MADEFRDFKLPHILFVLVAGLAVRLLWRSFDKPDGLLAAIERGPVRAPWLWVEPYRPGAGGVERTLEAMRALVRQAAGDPAMRRAAASIVARCAGHQFACEIHAIYEFVRDRITYRRDPAGFEWVQDSRRTLQLGFGDCDDKSVLLAGLLASLGHRPRFALLGYSPRGRNYSHVYVEVYDSRGRRWIALDPTNERAPVGWQGRAASRGVYEIFK